MDALAITFKMDRRVDRIITPLAIRQAEDYCKSQHFTPSRLEVRAMWDTGATGCCVSKNLAESLGLTSISSLDLTSIHGTNPSNLI